MALSLREFFFPQRARRPSAPPRPKPPPKPAYSPQTEQQITQATINLALFGPRWIGEQMGQDLDESFRIGDTGVSLSQLIRHPIKTTKKTIRAWTVSSWQENLQNQLVAEYVWEPRLNHFVGSGAISPTERDQILDWVSKPRGNRKDLDFEALETARAAGLIPDDVWAGIQRQHTWEEFSRFRRKPGRYLWGKVFGKRGNKEAPLYKLTPQKWLGEPLKRYLGQTTLGQAVAGVRQAAKQLNQRIVDAGKLAVKAVGRGAVRVTRRIVTRVAGASAWAAISSAVGGAVGSLAGPLGTIIGALVGAFAGKIFKWSLQIVFYSCSCLAVALIAVVGVIVLVVGSAFHTSGTGGAPGSPVSIVQVQKTADKTHLDVGAGMGVRDPNERIVGFTITVKNVSDQEITGGKIVSEYDLSLFTPSALGGGIMDAAAGTLTWDVPSLPKGNTAIVNYDGFVDTSTDQIVVDKATFSGQIAGTTVEGVATATVVVGTGGTGLNPSGWPLAQGCITQGPEGSTSHARFGEEAVDIAPVNPLDILFADRAIYATHDGIAYAGHDPGGYGNYVTVASPLGFRTIYAHMDSDIAITNGEQVYPGTFLGNVCKGLCGLSDATHLHYEFDGLNLRMEQPNIPVDVERDCDGRGDCNLCFGT